MLKKITICVLGFILCFLIIANFKTTDNQQPQSFSYTFGEVKDILENYFKEQKISLKEGSKDYYFYLLSQLIENSDQNLMKHSQYQTILDYASIYTVLYQDIEYNNQNDLSAYFSKNIGQISQELKAEERKLDNESKQNINTFTSSYIASNAVNYAIKDNKDDNVTYFISQSLIAGGLKQDKKPSTNQKAILKTASQWYYEEVENTIFCSSSFVRLSDFFLYWKNRIGYTSYPSIIDCQKEIKGGDVVILENKNTGIKYYAVMISHDGLCYGVNNSKVKKFSSLSDNNNFYRLRFE